MYSTYIKLVTEHCHSEDHLSEAIPASLVKVLVSDVRQNDAIAREQLTSVSKVLSSPNKSFWIILPIQRPLKSAKLPSICINV